MVTKEMAERTEHLPDCAGWEDCDCFSKRWGHAEIYAMQEEVERLRNAASDLVTCIGRNTVMEWRPIDTAPKDADILIHCPVIGCVRGRWRDDAYAAKPRPYWANDREHLFGVVQTRADQPTHWMPLPDPPNPQAQRPEGAA